MLLNQQIMQLIGNEPGLTATQIAEKLSQNPKSVKVILHKFTKQEKILREKKARLEKTKGGPQSLYVYSAKPL